MRLGNGFLATGYVCLGFSWVMMVECGNGMLGGGGVEVKVWILTLLSSTEREKAKYLI